jgi:DNA-binding transcriptional MerR regulator
VSASPARAFMTIGEVLAELRTEFPDVTISKIRFLESEGLIEPARTQSGYRKFTHTDVVRLRYVLSAQRDHYLPLRVIRGHLDAIDRGEDPSLPASDLPQPPVTPIAAAPGITDPEDPRGPRRVTRKQLLETAGIDEARLRQLETYGLVESQGGSHPYDTEAVMVAKIAGELAYYGLEPRHLRSFKTAADREVSLIEQVVAPLVRGRDSESAGRAGDTAREIAALSVKLHAALVRGGLSAAFGS